ncbi:hypothetical protein HK405_001292 [Cladochytrium tenue]|nr:hypothetical protein HK405_001292 [Cladochytrium tenue]
MPQPPRVRVRAAQPADVDAITQIHFAAFQSNPVSRAIYPPTGLPSADARGRFERSMRDTLTTAAGVTATANPTAVTASGESQAAAAVQTTPASICTVVAVAERVDDGAVVGYAKWTLRAEPLKSADDDAEPLPVRESVGEGVNFDVLLEFRRELRAQRQKWRGTDPSLLLNTLAVAPEVQRSGAGAALVSWGSAQLADTAGLPTLLEATPAGYGLYTRLGFRPVETIDFEATSRWGVVNAGEDWGARCAVDVAGPLATGMFRLTVMLRGPVGIDARARN